MPKAVNQLAGAPKLWPKSQRKPLQPKNTLTDAAANETAKTKAKPKQEWIEISPVEESNKENNQIYSTPAKTEPRDPSLGEELSAVRKKLDRLRLDKERTERMLKERGVMLEKQIKEMERRRESQKELEIEVDRLYRLKELQSFCMRVSPIKSLREKEQEKRIIRGQTPAQQAKSGDLEESTGENIWPSPCSDYADTIEEETEESDI